MYSPKIKKDLIPVLYKLAKQKGKPMTQLVDEILRKELTKRGCEICRDGSKEEISINQKKRANHRGVEDVLKG